MLPHLIRLCGCLAVLLCMAVPGHCQARDEAVGVLISREIAPYVSMVEGLESRLGNLPVQRFFLDDQGKPYSLGGHGAMLNPAQYAVLVAVGPEALRYLLPRVGPVPLVYSMVLSPENVVGAVDKLPCGVSLNIPVKDQFAAIRRHFPTVARLGVLFDPENNRAWFEDASAVATAMGLELVPLRVNRQSAKLDIIGDFTQVDTILFIPDKSIISKAVIQHVIKQAVLHRIPVVGYNQFFYDSGAALSFIIDYPTVGHQVAAQVQQLLAGDKCQETIAPSFATRVNEDALRALGLKIPAAAER